MTNTRQQFRFRIEDRDGRVLAKFSFLSEAETAANALALAYDSDLKVIDAKTPGYIYHRPGRDTANWR